MNEAINALRAKKLMVRWSLIGAALTTLYWVVFYIVNGSVTAVSSIDLGKTSINLPFSVYRWWDALIVPFWTIALVSLARRIDEYPDTASDFSLIVILGAAIVAAILGWIGAGLVGSLAIGLSACFVIYAGFWAVYWAGKGCIKLCRLAYWRSLSNWLFALDNGK